MRNRRTYKRTTAFWSDVADGNTRGTFGSSVAESSGLRFRLDSTGPPPACPKGLPANA